jgi:hypothetical protein
MKIKMLLAILRTLAFLTAGYAQTLDKKPNSTVL